MNINLQLSRIWGISLIYAIWLNGITFVFYMAQGEADVRLQLALVAGSIPVALQMIFCRVEMRNIMRPFVFTCIFMLIIVLSLIQNPTDYFMFVNIFNILFVFCVATIIATYSDFRIILYIASLYAVIGSAILVLINIEGTYIWGRLYTDGVGPNSWGGTAVSVGVAAFALRNRVLAVACWIIVFMTLFNTASRASMVALLGACMIVAAAWLAETRKKYLVLSLTVVLLCIFGLLWASDLMPEAFYSFIYHDLLWLDDKYRGLGTGATGRMEAWIETLRIWMSNPVFGVGFRQHEDILTSESSAHNAYLTMLADTGLFGLIAYVLLISMSLKEAWRRQVPMRVRFILLAVITSYAVLGLFERRALNAGNPYSILFVICCYYSLRIGADIHSHRVDQRLGGESISLQKS